MRRGRRITNCIGRKQARDRSIRSEETSPQPIMSTTAALPRTLLIIINWNPATTTGVRVVRPKFRRQPLRQYRRRRRRRRRRRKATARSQSLGARLRGRRITNCIGRRQAGDRSIKSEETSPQPIMSTTAILPRTHLIIINWSPATTTGVRAFARSFGDNGAGDAVCTDGIGAKRKRDLH